MGLATVVNTPAGADNLGARLLLRFDGSVIGSLGDPRLDSQAIEIARRVAELGSNESLITNDGTEIFVEGFTTPPTLVMVGGGHVGKATADLAHTLGYRVFVVDDRPEFANDERFPYAEQIVVAPYDDWSSQVSLNVNSFIVVATRGHRFDDMALESALAAPSRYIGLLGSRRKTLMIYQRLVRQGTPADRLKQVRSPIGLDIGALTPEELAVSILSEIIMVRRGGAGSPMQMGDWYVDRAAEISIGRAFPLYRPAGQPPQDADDLSAVGAPGYARGPVETSPLPHRPRHWCADPGGTGGQHSIGNHNGAAGRRRKPNANG